VRRNKREQFGTEAAEFHNESILSLPIGLVSGDALEKLAQVAIAARMPGALLDVMDLSKVGPMVALALAG
jgi:hypothetical protein